MDEAWTIQELAGRWKITEDTVRGLVRSGQLVAMRIGRQLRVKDEEVKRYEKLAREEVSNERP